MSDVAPKKPRRFSSEYQPERKRGKGKFTMIEEAFKRKGYEIEEFYDMLVDKAMSEKDASMIREILIRCNPLPKSTSPMVNFEFDNKWTPVQKIDSIIDGVSGGEIPADVASLIVGMVKAGMEAQEITEIIERIEHLEKMLGGRIGEDE